MAFESVNATSFLLKPGGAMEEAMPTELGKDQYSQSSGITHTGRLIRMPGKRLVQQFQDRVLQIAGFGGAVIIQHGSTIEMYPDACALSPTDDDDANMIVVQLPPQTNYWAYDGGSGSPNPWTAHPNDAAPAFYHDIPYPTENLISQGGVDNNHFSTHLAISSGCTRFGANNTYEFSCGMSSRRFGNFLDLRAYTPDVYDRAILIGDLTTYKPGTDAQQGGFGTTTQANGYTWDVSQYLGTLTPGRIFVPFPKMLPDNLDQFHYRNDVFNSDEYLFQVDITGIRLYLKNSTSYRYV